jgi:hypothetical protein
LAVVDQHEWNRQQAKPERDDGRTPAGTWLGRAKVKPGSPTTGRARAALVFGDGDAAVATVSAVLARRQTDARRERLLFAGPASFTALVVQHLNDTVLPLVDHICDLLDVPRTHFEISVVNLSAASASDLPLSISGFSADAPAFLAMLSEALGIPLEQDFVATGHIASSDGDVRFVRSTNAKLAAAMREPEIRRFIYPAMDADTSLDTLAPGEHQKAAAAVAADVGDLRLTGVSDIEGLLRETLSEEGIVLGALKSGFFHRHTIDHNSGAAPARAADYLCMGNDRRFWTTLEAHLVAGRHQETTDLLHAWVDCHCRRGSYPSGCGVRIQQLLGSLAPALRRLKIQFPLLPMQQCVQLGRLAAETEAEDVRQFLAAVAGRTAMRDSTQTEVATTTGHAVNTEATLDTALTAISAQALVQKIDGPVDAVRAAYVLPSVLVGSYDEFIDAVAAFYLAMLRGTGAAPANAERSVVTMEAMSLVERTFADHGGLAAAAAESQYGVNGGMRLVLDRLADHYKHEQRSKYINWVLKEFLDPLDWDSKVAVVAALLKRVSPYLPPELRSRPAASFASQYEVLVRAYSDSLEQMKRILRQF